MDRQVRNHETNNEFYPFESCEWKKKGLELVCKWYSAIHKATIQRAAIQNGLWRALCTVASFDILGIIPGKPVEQP